MIRYGIGYGMVNTMARSIKDELMAASMDFEWNDTPYVKGIAPINLGLLNLLEHYIGEFADER